MTLGMPRPAPTHDSEPFWAATADGELIVQHCNACGHNQLYPRMLCVACHRQELDWWPASGRGTVYSVTVVRRAPSLHFVDDVPYAIALVDLVEGPRLMANIVGCPPQDVTIDLPVVVDFDDLAGGVRVPRFRPEA